MSKKVIMCGPHHYTSVFQVGSHHYARAFEKLGYEVLFLSAPISPFHKLFANNSIFKEKEIIYKKGGERINNIFHYVPKTLFSYTNKPFFSSNFVLNNWYKLTYPNLLNFIKKLKFNSIDILWIDNTVYWFLLKTINFEKSIFRISDNSKGFLSSTENYHKKEKYISKHVDKILYSAKNLEKNKQYKDILKKEKMLYLRNGIDFELFNKADKSLPKEFMYIPKPRITYVGAIQYWFDENLLFKVANKLKNYNFILIGPVGRSLNKLSTLKNVHILGSKSYEKVPSYLYHSDVGIIPFDVKNYPDLVNSINPIKLYEYMACGLPVVSTDWDEIRNINSPALLAKNADEFAKKIYVAIDHKLDNKNKYIEFARKNDWSENLKKVLFSLDIK